MKRTHIFFLTAWALLFGAAPLCAQTAGTASAQKTIGYINEDSLLHTLPAYHEAQEKVQQLRNQYKAELTKNQKHLQQQYEEYQQQLTTLTPNILAYRQLALQTLVEQNLQFRQQADSVINATEAQLLQPVRSQLQSAIRKVGTERGYHAVINTSSAVAPYLSPVYAEDITPFVKFLLQ